MKKQEIEVDISIEPYHYTVEFGYIGSLRTAKFIRYIRNPIYTRNFLLFPKMGTENFIRYIRLSDMTESIISEFYSNLHLQKESRNYVL